MTHPTLITAQPGLPFVDIVREFNAPAAAVFRAHTQAELYAQWLGPRSSNLDSLELDATAGGRWKYTFQLPGGPAYSSGGSKRSYERSIAIYSGLFCTSLSE